VTAEVAGPRDRLTIVARNGFALPHQRTAAVPGTAGPGLAPGVDGAAPVPDLAEAYRAAQAELESLKRDRKQVARKLRAESQLRPWQVELLKLQRHLDARQMRMIVLFEGRDAAGKGGTIRRVTRYMNEKHYRVVAMGKPTEDQRSQWYFQRYAAQLPAGGEIVLFDRSWYNRAMVEPVFGFCTEEEHEHFMQGVTGFEKDLVRQGTVLIKLYFSVTREEQRRRFARRYTDPLRQWKFSEIDMQAQDRWDDFTTRKYEMIKRTGTPSAPWVIIRSGDKQKARLNAIKVMLNAVDYRDRSTELDFAPDPEIVVPGGEEVLRMEAERARSGSFTS
jgi:polyphosphate kinase 2